MLELSGRGDFVVQQHTLGHWRLCVSEFYSSSPANYTFNWLNCRRFPAHRSLIKCRAVHIENVEVVKVEVYILLLPGLSSNEEHNVQSVSTFLCTPCIALPLWALLRLTRSLYSIQIATVLYFYAHPVQLYLQWIGPIYFIIFSVCTFAAASLLVNRQPCPRPQA